MKDWLRNNSPEVILLLIVLVLLAIVMLHGCSRPPRSVPALPPVAVAPTPTTEHARVESAEDKVDRISGELKQAQSQLDHAQAAEREARLAGVRSLITWLTAICSLVGILSVGAFVFLRMKSLLLLTAACAAMVATAQASHVLLDHPIIAGSAVLVLIAGSIVVIFWKQRHTEHGLMAAVQVVESLKPEVETDVERMERRLMQSKLVEQAGPGALKAIESVRDKLAAMAGAPK